MFFKRLLLLFMITTTFSSHAQMMSGSGQDENLEFEFNGFGYAGFDWYRGVVNLTPYRPDSTSGEDDLPVMRTGHYEDGFMVYHAREFYVGGGPSGNWHFENVTGIAQYLWGFVGLAVALDHNVEFSSFVQYQENIDLVRKDKKIPYHATEFDKWAPGDSVYFHTMGGVALSGRVGAYTVGVGPTFIATGGWQYYVEKMTPGKIFVNVMKSSVQKVNIVAGTYVAEIAAEYVNELSKGFSFVFDLEDQDSLMAYEDMMRGNIIPAQKMADEALSDGVVRVERIRRHKKRRIKRFAVGLPMIYYVLSREKKTEVVHRHFEEDGKEIDTFLASDITQRVGRFFNRQKISGEGFHAGMEVETRDGLSVANYKGQFQWSYSSAVGTRKKLKRALERLLKRTGMREELEVVVPDEKRLKFTSVNFTMDISPEYLNHLLGGESIETVTARLEELSLVRHERYFHEGIDYDNICKGSGKKDMSRSCRERFLKSIRSNIKTAKKSLVKMKKILTDTVLVTEKKGREFTRLFAEFGSSMTANQFLLGATLEDSRKCGSGFDFVVEGEKLSRYVKRGRWDVSERCSN